MKRHQRFQMSDIPFHWFLSHFDFISFFIAGYLFFVSWISRCNKTHLYQWTNLTHRSSIGIHRMSDANNGSGNSDAIGKAACQVTGMPKGKAQNMINWCVLARTDRSLRCQLTPMGGKSHAIKRNAEYWNGYASHLNERKVGMSVPIGPMVDQMEITDLNYWAGC